MTTRSSSSTSSISSSSDDSTSSTSYLWKYVTVATKAATDYVGLTRNNNNNYNNNQSENNHRKKIHSKSQPNLYEPNKYHHYNNNNIKNHHKSLSMERARPDLYDEIGCDVLNFLANLLDSSRPKLNAQKIITESTLSLMQKNYVLLIEIFTFLPFENIIMIIKGIEDNHNIYYQLKLSLDYLIYNDLSGHQYIRECCINGYSLQNRNKIWPFLVCNNIEITKYYQLYDKYISHVMFFQHPIIQKDIDRTLIINYDIKDDKYDYYGSDNNNDVYINRTHDVLNDIYKKKLKAILSIYCMLDPQIGYIQGMNYIAANILIALHGDVHNAFAIFCHFMKRDLSPIHIYGNNGNNINNNNNNNNNKKNNNHSSFVSHAYCGGGRYSKTGCIGYGLRDLYLPSLPGLIVSLLQFEKLIMSYHPLLYSYFVDQGIEIQNFASEWFLSLFCYILPLKISLRIMDIFIVDGWKILHRAGLALLDGAKYKILNDKLGFDKILLLLKRKDLIEYLFNNDEHRFIKLSMSFKVSNAKHLHLTAVEILTKCMIRKRM